MIFCFLTPFLVWFLGRWLPNAFRPWVGPMLPLLVVAWAVRYADTPSLKLLASSLWLLWALKGWIVLRHPRAEVLQWKGLALYASVWPGMDPLPLVKRSREVDPSTGWFVQGWVTMVVGAVLGLAVAMLAPGSGWLGLLAIITTCHLGYADVLSCLVRLARFPVARLFDNPLLATSLRDFWSRRWNRPFVEMNRVLFLAPLQRMLGRRGGFLGAFLLSGVLHDFAISFPAGGGWGLPSLYFLLHGLAMMLERRLGSARWPAWFGRLWTWGWLLLPLPLLFHSAFRAALVVPLFTWVHSVLPANPLFWLLTLAGYAHFLVLAASFQVPHRLGWHVELQRIRPLNRKLLWVYGGFIVGMIVSLGVLVLRLRPEILAGDRAALHVVGLTAVWWTARIVVDALVFEHSDWPEGPEFVLGHTMLTTLFVFLASTMWLTLFLAK